MDLELNISPVCPMHGAFKTSCRPCAAKAAHTRRQQLTPEDFDFLDPSIDPAIRLTLTKTKETKVPVVCSTCHTTASITFTKALKQRRKNGYYRCRGCQARLNGKLVTAGCDALMVTRVQTNIERFGVDHPMQRPEIVATKLETQFGRK